MRKPKPTRTLLKAAMARCDEKLAAWEGDTNPQIIEMRARVKGEKRAFEAVLDHLRGDSISLEIYANY